MMLQRLRKKGDLIKLSRRHVKIPKIITSIWFSWKSLHQYIMSSSSMVRQPYHYFLQFFSPAFSLKVHIANLIGDITITFGLKCGQDFLPPVCSYMLLSMVAITNILLFSSTALHSSFSLGNKALNALFPPMRHFSRLPSVLPLLSSFCGTDITTVLKGLCHFL